MQVEELEDNDVTGTNIKPNDKIMEAKKVEDIDVASIKLKNGKVVEGRSNKQECTTIGSVINVEVWSSTKNVKPMAD